MLDTLLASAGAWLLVIVVSMTALFFLSGLRLVPNNKIGVVEKRLSGRGSVKSGLIAMNGEAGFQPEVLRGGLHFLLPIQYSVHMMPLVTIPQGKIGYVFARDGAPLPPTQALASNTVASDLQDVIGGSGGNGHGNGGGMSGNVMEALLAMLLSDKIGSDLGASAAVTPRNAAADAMRSKIQRDLEPKGSDPRGSV